MSIKKEISLTSEADKIMVDEMLPIITKMFSSITSELIVFPHHWEDKNGNIKKVYDITAEKCIAFLTDCINGTAQLQYELLCKPPVKANDS